MKIENTLLFALLAAGAVVTTSVNAGGGNSKSTLTVINCVGEQIQLESYNKKDGLMAVPFSEKNLAHGASTTLDCGSKDECKIRYEGPTCGGSFNTAHNVKVGNGRTMAVYATGEWKSEDTGQSKGTWPVVGANTNAPASCAGYTPVSCR
ncbi:MAG: hypothetical protein ACFCBW_15935 [Candidatus Competibacterales bacterium]